MWMMIEYLGDILGSIRLRIMFFLLIFVYTIGLFTYVLTSFRSDDTVPQVKTISTDMRRNFRDFSSQVRAGLFINSFPEFDFIKNNFVIDAMVWFDYNKNELMLSTIDSFSFENCEMKSKSPAKIRRYGDRVLAKYQVKFNLKTDVDFHRFPLEDHSLSLVLINDRVSAEEMYFNDDARAISFEMGPDATPPNWAIGSTSVVPGYSLLEFDKYQRDRVVYVPKVIFSIDFHHHGLNKIFIILVPMFAAIFFALFAFFMSFNSYQGKYVLSLTSVTALLGYRFVILQMSPSVGYLTIADQLFIFFIMLSFFIFAFQVIMVRQYMFLIEQKNVSAAERALSDVVMLTPRRTEQIGSIIFFLTGLIFMIVATCIVV